MASSDLDELQKLELKEAFDEFDKVILPIQNISNTQKIIIVF